MPTPAETEVAATTGGGAQQTEPDHVSHVETQAEPPTTAADQSGPEGGSDSATAATTADNAPNEGGCCAGGACCGDDIVFTSDEEDDEPKVTVAAADTTAACESGCCGGGTETLGESVPTQATATTTADNSGGCTDGCCGDDIIFTSDEEDAAEEAVPSAGDGDPAVAATGGGGVAVSTSINVDDTNVDTATPDDTNQIKVIDNCGCGTCCEEVGEGDKHTGCGVGTSHAANADPASIAGSCCCGPPGARDEKSTTIRIQNMCCEQEAVLIRKLVAQQTGVTKVSVSVIGRLAVIDHCRFPCCVSPEALVAALNKAKLGASIRDSGTARSLNFSVDSRSRLELTVVWLVLIIALIMLIPREDDLTEAAEYLSLVGTILGGARVMYLAAWQLRYLTIGMNVLIAIAILGTIILGALGHREAWVDGCILVAIFLAVEQLEAWYMLQVAKALSDVGVSTVSETALLTNGKAIQVDDIVPGDTVAVRAGDQVPVDGEVIRGSGAIDESAMTGESMPLHKEKGSTVLGGTVCQQGYLEVRATTAGTGTMLQKIVALLERAQGEKTRSQTMIESFVKFYTPIVLLCALIYGVVCGQTNDGEDDCVKAALVVLILACPCALVAAAPSPIAFGTAAAVRGGAVIKSPQAFEDLAAYVEPLPSFHYVALARPSLTPIGALHQFRSPEGRCRTVVFDKTGTLTEGNFDVVNELWLHDKVTLSQKSKWDLVVAVQARSTHPIAAALVRYASGGCVAEAYDDAAVVNGTNMPVAKFKAVPGVGVSGVVTALGRDTTVVVGNRKAVELAGATLLPDDAAMIQRFESKSDGCTIVYTMVDGVVEFLAALSDVVRADSFGAVTELQKRGIETVMLTGDRVEAAKRVCSEVGITTFEAGLKPEDKLAWVSHRVDRGDKVLMIGDGMNDGPSLVAATVGVAMGAGGTAMAVESASVVMVRDEIGMIPNLISLSQRCKQRIRENIFLAVAIKIVFVGLALSSVLTELWVAVLVDGISVLLVLANSGRGLRSFKQSTNDAPIDDPIDDSVIITPRDVIASPTFKMSEV